jgi:hypothetical protein
MLQDMQDMASFILLNFVYTLYGSQSLWILLLNFLYQKSILKSG